MKIRTFLVISTALAPIVATNASANDASYTTTTTQTGSVTVYGYNTSGIYNGGVDTAGGSSFGSDGSYDDGVVKAGGNFSYTSTSIQTATSLNSSGTSATTVGNSSA